LTVKKWHDIRDDGHNRFGKNLSFGRYTQAHQYDVTVIFLMLQDWKTQSIKEYTEFP